MATINIEIEDNIFLCILAFEKALWGSASSKQ